MNEIKRITVEMIKQAYADSGYIPYSGGSFRHETSKGIFACALGAFGRQGLPDPVSYLETQGYEREYLYGFSSGFDGFVEMGDESIRYQGLVDGMESMMDRQRLLRASMERWSS